MNKEKIYFVTNRETIININPDLILLDINLSGADGERVIKKLN